MPASTRPADADLSPAPTGPATVDATRTIWRGPTSPALAAAASWALSNWGVGSNAVAHPLPSASGAEAGTALTVDGMLGLAMHDLRNSLSALQLGVELLSRRESAAEQAVSAVLTHMDNAGQRAQASAMELEDVYRLAAGRKVAVSPVHFTLHAVVRETLDACRLIVPGVAVEHDRLGEGDCVGDPARMAQFLALALEDLCLPGPPALIIVVSEVAGERFRIAVHADNARGAMPADPAAAPGPVQARRRVLLRAIAQAHGGEVRFEQVHAQGRSIDGSFSSPAAASDTSAQGLP